MQILKNSQLHFSLENEYSDRFLVDAVAEKLQHSFFSISIEMVYRSLYFFTQARHRGETDNVVAYLAANQKMLGIIKRKRRSKKPSPLETIPALLTKQANP